MLLLRPHRFVLSLLGSSVALVTLLGARPAAAQQITIGKVTRNITERQSIDHPEWINYSDCIKDGKITFRVNLPSPEWQNDALEIWAGSSTDCTDYAQRQGTSPTCWNVYSANAGQGTAEPAVVRMQDIVAQKLNTDPVHGVSSGTAQDCEKSLVSTPTAVALYFMLVDGTGQIAAGTTGTEYKNIEFDLLGPAAPTNVKTGIGETQLIVGWDPSLGSGDLVGYHIFCDPKPGAASTSQPLEGGAAGGSGGADASATGSGGTGGATGNGGSAGGNDAGTGVTLNPDCPSTALVPGKRPDPAYLCGTVRGLQTTSGNASGLTNFQSYAVAVAAFDGVYNDGPLSVVACGTPEPVNDFYDLYTTAGGKGGGGFCGIADKPAPGVLGAFILAFFASILRRRRRRS